MNAGNRLGVIEYGPTMVPIHKLLSPSAGHFDGSGISDNDLQAGASKLQTAVEQCIEIGLCSENNPNCPAGMFNDKPGTYPPECKSCFSEGPRCNADHAETCTRSQCTCVDGWEGDRCDIETRPDAGCKDKLLRGENLVAFQQDGLSQAKLCSPNRAFELVVQSDSGWKDAPIILCEPAS